MAAHGARRLQGMVANVAGIVAIEWLAATQGCDFHAPLSSSATLERVRRLLRSHVPPLEEDRYLYPDICAATDLVTRGVLAESVPEVALPWVCG